jgi:hypothetical protein
MESQGISNTEIIYQVKRKLSIIHGTINMMMYKRLELAYSLCITSRISKGQFRQRQLMYLGLKTISEFTSIYYLRRINTSICQGRKLVDITRVSRRNMSSKQQTNFSHRVDGVCYARYWVLLCHLLESRTKKNHHVIKYTNLR